MLLQGVIGAPGSTADGQNPIGLMGRSGELIDTKLHGDYYTANYRGRIFIATTVVAGVTLPVQAASLASKFCIVNPVSSSVNLELIDFDWGVQSATEVVNAIQLYYQTGAAAITGLGSLTAGTILPGTISGGGNPSAIYYTAATHTGTPAPYKQLGMINATANGIPVSHYDFNGKVIVPPGGIIDVAASVGAQANFVCSLTWAEWPI